MKNNIKKRAEGFTIIEVLIVLAIAGLIILLVLLAVPALNRNNRNTSRKSDISRIAGALTNFVSNNNGALPSIVAAQSIIDGNIIIADAGTLGQYRTPFAAASPAVDNSLTIVTGTQAALGTTTVDRVQIVTNALCGTAGATTITGATARNLAIQYTVESGTANVVTPICQNI